MEPETRTLEYMLPALYEHGEIREVEIDGAPWFVAADVCAALDIKNPSQAARTLEDEDWRRAVIGEAAMLVLSEPGVYELVMRCRSRRARRQLIDVLVERGPSVEAVMNP